MDACCQNKSKELGALRKSQGGVLKVVLAINAVMFIVEIVAGLRASSLALTGDALDMLGDAIAYASSLWALDLGMKQKAQATRLKGLIMGATALAVLARGLQQVLGGATPIMSVMGGVGGLALVMNALCLAMLTRHRRDDLNMRSVWLCSRNDIIANCAVLIAAAAVAMTRSRWPDVVVGLGITLLFAQSALAVLKEARATLVASA